MASGIPFRKYAKWICISISVYIHSKGRKNLTWYNPNFLNNQLLGSICILVLLVNMLNPSTLSSYPSLLNKLTTYTYKVYQSSSCQGQSAWYWIAETYNYYSHICTVIHKNSKILQAINITTLCEEFFPGWTFPFYKTEIWMLKK